MNRRLLFAPTGFSGCGKLCARDNVTYLVTRLALIEGSILDRLENRKAVCLSELMENLEWEPCAVAMAVGSLIRQGFVKSVEHGLDVFLELPN